MTNVSVVIAAGGKGTRMGTEENKMFMKLCGREILFRTAEVFSSCPEVDEIVVSAPKSEHTRVSNMLRSLPKICAITTGGATRQESVYNGIGFTHGEIILIHDGARALIRPEEIAAAVDAAQKYGAAAVGVPCKDTLKSADGDGFITGTVDRDKTFLIQTPQAFRRSVIVSAHEKARAESLTVTDDCGLVEHYGGRIKIVTGKYDNIKITTPDDIEIAEKILKKRQSI